MSRVAILSGPYPVNDQLGGIGLRLWELAQVLADCGHEITIVAPSPSDFAHPGVRIGHAREEAVEWCDAILSTDLPDSRLLLAAHRQGKLLLVENAPPIEHLHFPSLQGEHGPDLYADIVARWRLQLLLADHLLVRSEAERAATLGALVGTGRMGHLHHHADSALAHLISLLPIGFNRHSADRAARAPIDATSHCDVLWNGGVWEYVDPQPVFAALAQARAGGDPLSLGFLYPPPPERQAELQRLASELGVAQDVRWPSGPVPHRQRDGHVKAARALVVTGGHTAETMTCHRLRLRDAGLYRLPIVVDSFGGTGDLVAALGIGPVLDPSDPVALARGLIDASRDGPVSAAVSRCARPSQGPFPPRTPYRQVAGRPGPRHHSARPRVSLPPHRRPAHQVSRSGPSPASRSLILEGLMPHPTAAGFTHTTDLPVWPAPTIEIRDWSLSEQDRTRIVDSYRRCGYALAQTPGTEPDPDDLLVFAAALNLGEVFTPPLYSDSKHTRRGISRLTAGVDQDHPFGDRQGQAVHCDGTLQQLGQIPTMVMLCVRPAAHGGLTYLVNLVGAFSELLARDPRAAVQLTHDRALERRSTFRPENATVGPAFALDTDGRLFTRYGRTATDTYRPTDEKEREALLRAVAFIDQAADAGSPYRLDLTLTTGQALVVANDRIGHGRTAYQDQPAAPRLLLRGLFTRRPT